MYVNVNEWTAREKKRKETNQAQHNLRSFLAPPLRKESQTLVWTEMHGMREQGCKAQAQNLELKHLQMIRDGIKRWRQHISTFTEYNERHPVSKDEEKRTRLDVCMSVCSRPNAVWRIFIWTWSLACWSAAIRRYAGCHVKKRVHRTMRRTDSVHTYIHTYIARQAN